MHPVYKLVTSSVKKMQVSFLDYLSDSPLCLSCVFLLYFFVGGWGGRGGDFLQVLYLYVTTYYKYDMLVCVCVCCVWVADMTQ